MPRASRATFDQPRLAFPEPGYHIRNPLPTFTFTISDKEIPAWGADHESPLTFTNEKQIPARATHDTPLTFINTHVQRVISKNTEHWTNPTIVQEFLKKKSHRYYTIATTSDSDLDSPINTKLYNNNSNISKVVKTYYLSKEEISKTTSYL